MVNVIEFSPGEPWFESCCHLRESLLAPERTLDQSGSRAQRKVTQSQLQVDIVTIFMVNVVYRQRSC